MTILFHRVAHKYTCSKSNCICIIWQRKKKIYIFPHLTKASFLSTLNITLETFVPGSIIRTHKTLIKSNHVYQSSKVMHTQRDDRHHCLSLPAHHTLVSLQSALGWFGRELVEISVSINLMGFTET